MPTFIKNAGGGGEQINAAVQVKVLAADSIQIGDTVYTVDKAGDIRGDLTFMGLDSDVNAAVFSPDGNLLVLGGNFYGSAKVYSVNGTAVTFVGGLYADAAGTALYGGVNTAAFSPDGNLLVLGGSFTGRAKVYSVNGTAVTFVGNLYADAAGTALSGRVSTAAFSPDGTALVLGGGFTGYAKVYSVNGTAVTFVGGLYADAAGTALDDSVNTAVFAPDGGTLVLGGDFIGCAKVYSVSGTTISYVSDIYADAAGTEPIDRFYTAAFSPDGGTLVLSVNFDGPKVYSVSGTTISYVSDIYADAAGTALDDWVYSAAFSPDGGALVLGGQFIGYGKVYSVSGTAVTYVSDIYANTGSTVLDGSASTAVFSPDGTTLVLGGWFTICAKVYSVSGTTISYVSDIYADAGTTALDGDVNAAVFSPDGNLLVLGGSFTGRAKVYSVNGTALTFVGNLYADAGTTALDNYVNTAAFSPDGTALVLGGKFTGLAKVYSVSGTAVTFVSDIYADAAGTALGGRVSTAAFAPDGGTLVLGGSFTGRAKVYSVSGTAVTFVSDIYADAGTTALRDEVRIAAFSPDGGALVLGGSFTGRPKVYSVSGTTISYVGDIYADAAGTALDDRVYTAAFAPDGGTLVLGGSFTGRAKVYSVSGTALTFVGNLYADAAGTALDDMVSTAVFAPDGGTLVLGGSFDGCSKWYAVLQGRIVYALAHLAPGGNIPEGINHVGVGFAKSTMAAEASGTVKLIGRIG